VISLLDANPPLKLRLLGLTFLDREFATSKYWKLLSLCHWITASRRPSWMLLSKEVLTPLFLY